MAGLRDLFDQGKGQLARGFAIMKDKVAGTAQTVKDTADHVRAARSAKAQPATAGTPGPGARSPLDPSFETPLADHNAKIRSMNNPYLADDAGQRAIGKANDNFKAQAPRAEAVRGPANDAALKRQMKAARGGALRGAATAVGKGLGAAGGLAMAADTATTGTDEYRAELGLPATAAVGRGLRSIGVPESAAQLGDDVAVRFAGAANRVAGGALGLLPDGAAPRPQAPGRPAVAPTQDVQVPAQPAGQAQVQPPLDPAAMLAGTAPVEPGTGAFQRTTPGNVGRPTAIRSAPTQVAAAQRPQGDIAGAIRSGAQLASEIRQGKAAERGVDRAIRAAAAGTAGRTANRADVQAEARDEIARDPAFKGLEKDERAAAIEQGAADLTNRMRHTSAAIGRDLGDLTPVQRSQMRLANRFRNALDKNKGAMEWFNNFFGDKQFDSENLLSYVPADFKAGVTGGWVTMRNGNQIRVDKVVRNGETHWFSPNAPVDTDMTALVELARQQKKGAR